MTVVTRGGAHAYRLLDAGYSISLDTALDLLASSAPERVRPVRGEAAALQIANPPVSVILGGERVTVGGSAYDAEVSARIFDFGVVSLCVRVRTPRALAWDEFAAFGSAIDADAGIPELLEHHAQLLYRRIMPAIERPTLAPVREDYVVFRLHEVCGDDGGRLTSETLLQRVDVMPLLLNERRALS
ncbi:MAG TPA: hypothetical protein VFV33_00030, partial [Gemmatimonadaceae bacterium]|nr:hypothetical protein [Gemmatimonadaceae bacterium]